MSITTQRRGSYEEALEIIREWVTKTDQLWINDDGRGTRLFDPLNEALWGNLGRPYCPTIQSRSSVPSDKLQLAIMRGKHNVIPYDLVYDPYNQLIAMGVIPAVLDNTITFSQIDPELIKILFETLAFACREARISIQTGRLTESRTLPSSYYMWQSTMIGVTEPRMATKREAYVRDGDILIGIASSGLHCYGYDVILRLIDEKKLNLDEMIPGTDQRVGDFLLEPTACYSSVFKVYCNGIIGPAYYNPEMWRPSCAYIMRGGIIRNLGAIIPDGLKAVIDRGSWPIHPFYNLLRKIGNFRWKDLFGRFNMGIGLIWVARKQFAGWILEELKNSDGHLGVWQIGSVTKRHPAEAKVEILD